MAEPFDPYHKWLGIPPKDQPPNYYRLLAIELFEDDPEIISNAADRLMAHVRTFQNGPHSSVSQTLLNELAAARHTLLEPAKKSAYDQALRDQLLMAQAAQGPMAPIPVAPAQPMPIPAPVPLAAAVPQPVVAAPLPVSSPPLAAEPYAAPRITTRPLRCRTGWHVPAALLIIGATLVVTAYSLLQLRNKKPAAHQATPPKVVAEDAASADERVPPAVTAPSPTSIQSNAADSPDELVGGARRKPIAAVPAASPASRTAARINLLKLIDPARDAVNGEWRMEQGVLISAEESAPRLAIPFHLPPEYELSAVVERRRGDDAFSVGLIADAYKIAATVDGWHGAASGLQLVDGRSAEGNDTTRLGRVLRDGEPNVLNYTITKSEIRLICNGEMIIDYHGDFDRLSWPSDFRAPVPGRLELIGSRGSVFAISKLELAVLSDPARIAGPIRDTTPKPNSPAIVDAQKPDAKESRKTLGGLLNGPAIKPEPPDERELTKAERQARELYRDDLANAKLSVQKKALAQTLLDRGLGQQEDPAARYALLSLASEVAAEGGHAAAASAAIDELANWFQVDSIELKLEALAKANKAASAPQQKQELVKEALALVDASIEADAYEKVAKAIGIAQSAARSLKDSRLTKELADKKREADRLSKIRASLDGDLALLEQDDRDEQANLNVGRYYCLMKQQWDRGLPYLARGANPAYRALAERDLAKPDSASAQKELADEWWDVAQSEKGVAKTAALNRAGDWYRRAGPFLSGLDRELAEKRVREIEAGEDAADGKLVYLVDMNEASVSSDDNRLYKGKDDSGNELKVDGKPTPKGLLIEPPKQGIAAATYIVSKKYRQFTADVGVSPFPSRASSSPLTFELVGDGALLWRSKPIKQPADADHCEANVSKVINLELRVFCPGSNSGAKAVWIEPRLILK